MANSNPPIKNQAYTTVISLDSFATPGSKQLNPTLAAGDVKLRDDTGTYTNLGTLPVADGAGKSGVLVSLSAAEMNNDLVFVQFIDQTSPKEWTDFTLSIQTVAGVWPVGKTGYTLSAAGVQAIWDALTSALTVVGSIGKLLADNINATISSRSSHTAADVWASAARTLTAATNITSTGGTTVPQTGDAFARLGAPAGASVSADVAAVKAETASIKAKTDLIPAGGPAAASDYTAVRAAKLDNLDAAISSRSTYAGGDTAGTTTLLARVPGTVQPQTGDAFARLGAPAGASVSADVAAVKTVADAIKVKTDQLVFTIANKVDASIQAAGDFAQAAADKVWGTAARTLTAFGFSVTVGTNNDKTGYALTAAYDPAKTAAQAGDAMDLVPDAVDAAAVKADAVAEIQVGLATLANQTTINNNVLAVGAGVGALPTAAQNADKLLGRSLAGGADGGRTVQDALRPSRNKTQIVAGTLTVFAEDDATPAWTGAVTTAAGNPITIIDPA